jgi:hypothetical protein
MFQRAMDTRKYREGILGSMASILQRRSGNDREAETITDESGKRRPADIYHCEGMLPIPIGY